MKVRFFLRHGAMVEWPVPDPDNFSFQVLCLNIRAQGYFVAPDLFIPEDEIGCIGLEGGSARVVHPSPAAKQ